MSDGLTELRQILDRDIAQRFARITGDVLIVTPNWRNRAERKATLRELADLPTCRPHQNERACIRCRLTHLRDSPTENAVPMHHQCTFGRTCVLVPLVFEGNCLAYCQFTLDSSAMVDRYVELIAVLAENAYSRLIASPGTQSYSLQQSMVNDHGTPEQPGGHASNKWPEVVRRAVELIDRQFTDPDLTVATVARRLCLNRDYLSHLFRTQTGQRMSRHIFLRRMRHARTMLMTSNKQVRHVALSSGFLNTDWFSHTFHELEGVTPSQFRRNARRQAELFAPGH